MAYVNRALLIYLSITLSFTLGAAESSEEIEDGDNTFNTNSLAQQVTLYEALAACSYRDQSLAFISEKKIAEQDPFLLDYSSLQGSDDTKFWISILQSSQYWAYSFINMRSKVNGISGYPIKREEAINRTADNMASLFNTRAYKPACTTMGYTCAFTTDDSTKWRFFENNCWSDPSKVRSEAVIKCRNNHVNVVQSYYDDSTSKRLYGFLVGWYNQLYPSDSIKNTNAELYSCFIVMIARLDQAI